MKSNEQILIESTYNIVLYQRLETYPHKYVENIHKKNYLINIPKN